MKIILTLCLFMIVACSNSETTTASYSTTGSPISLYKTSVGKTLKKSITSIEEMQAESFDIDFDTVPNTTESWLIITNNSEDTITDLSITSDNSTFMVTPDTIVTMYPFERNVGLMQMIKVTIINGASPSGLGIANVIHGNQYATITISGKIRDTTFSTIYTFCFGSFDAQYYARKRHGFCYFSKFNRDTSGHICCIGHWLRLFSTHFCFGNWAFGYY